jgi:hypothetical protein
MNAANRAQGALGKAVRAKLAEGSGSLRRELGKAQVAVFDVVEDRAFQRTLPTMRHGIWWLLGRTGTRAGPKPKHLWGRILSTARQVAASPECSTPRQFLRAGCRERPQNYNRDDGSIEDQR